MPEHINKEDEFKQTDENDNRLIYVENQSQRLLLGHKPEYQ